MPTGPTVMSGMPGSAASFVGMSSIRGHNTGYTGFSGAPPPSSASAARFNPPMSVGPPPTIPVIVPSPPSASGARDIYTAPPEPPQPQQYPQPTGTPSRSGVRTTFRSASRAVPTGPPDAGNFPIPAPDPTISFTGAPTKIGEDEPAPVAPETPGGDAEPPPLPLPPPTDTSRTLQYAINIPTKELLKSQYKGTTLADFPISESRGAALVDATRPFYGTHRPA